MLNRTRIAAVLGLVLAIAVAGVAEARPSGSFRGGFSSGKSTAARSVATPRQPSFGSFGKRQAPPPAAARTPQRESAMSRDLDRRAAQDQAMRTYDNRRGAASTASAPAAGNAAAPPLPPLNPVMPGGSGNGGRSQPGGYSVPGGSATSAAAPVIVRDSGSPWLWGIGGFMLGRAVDGHAAAPAALQPAPVATTASAEPTGAAPGVVPPVPAAATDKPAENDGFTLGKLAFLLLVGGLVWLAWKAFRLMAAAQEVKKHANYSFERN